MGNLNMVYFWECCLLGNHHHLLLLLLLSSMTQDSSPATVCLHLRAPKAPQPVHTVLTSS
jgi:hypothetical protein